jgi:hypothetical protein
MPLDYYADFSSMFDEEEHATFSLYTSMDGSVLQVNVILDAGVTRIGFDSDIPTTHDECTFLNRDISSPARGDIIESDGICQVFVTEIENDGIISSWLVKNG